MSVLFQTQRRFARTHIKFAFFCEYSFGSFFYTLNTAIEYSCIKTSELHALYVYAVCMAFIMWRDDETANEPRRSAHTQKKHLHRDATMTATTTTTAAYQRVCVLYRLLAQCPQQEKESESSNNIHPSLCVLWDEQPDSIVCALANAQAKPTKKPLRFA